MRVVGVVGNQLVDGRADHGDQERVGRGRRFLDRAVRMTSREHDSVDLVITQGRRLFRGLQFGCQGKRGLVPTESFEHDAHGRPLPGTGVADIDALALQFVKRGDAGILAGDHGERLTVHREHRPQILVGAVVLELRRAVIGVVLPIRLGHAHVLVAGLDGVDVGDGTTGRRRRAFDAVLRCVAVDQFADRLTDDEVHAGLPAGADGDEFLVCCLGAAEGRRHRGDSDGRGQSFSQEHFHSSLDFIGLGNE